MFPAKGIECRVDHRRILVGNGAFLRDNNIVLNGAGSSADPSSEILVVRDGVHFGVIQIADTLRPEAKESVAALHALGLRTVLLTGDAKSIAKEVGIDVIHAEVLPDQKSEVLKQLVSRGRKVAMVGERCASTNAGNSWKCNGFSRSIMLSVPRNDTYLSGLPRSRSAGMTGPCERGSFDRVV
jgi:cation transport ATPase